MLKVPAVRTEHERLNREKFAILDKILDARREAGLTQVQIAQRRAPKRLSSHVWKAPWQAANIHPA